MHQIVHSHFEFLAFSIFNKQFNTQHFSNSLLKVCRPSSVKGVVNRNNPKQIPP